MIRFIRRTFISLLLIFVYYLINWDFYMYFWIKLMMFLLNGIFHYPVYHTDKFTVRNLNNHFYEYLFVIDCTLIPHLLLAFILIIFSNIERKIFRMVQLFIFSFIANIMRLTGFYILYMIPLTILRYLFEYPYIISIFLIFFVYLYKEQLQLVLLIKKRSKMEKIDIVEGRETFKEQVSHL